MTNCIVEHPLTIFPLGDSALTIELGDRISEELNRKALVLKKWLGSRSIPGVEDINIAYSSVSVYYDPIRIRNGKDFHGATAFSYLKEQIEELWRQDPSALSMASPPEEDVLQIPVCYDLPYGPDLAWLAKEKGISRDQAIHLHTSLIYRVYMIGFLPGFPYLGTIDPGLEIPRKDKPVPVMAGSVGIAGSQTGIYPVNTPGGWQIIGRTRLRLFDPAADPPVRLKTGDRVRFVAVTEEEYRATEMP